MVGRGFKPTLPSKLFGGCSEMTVKCGGGVVVTVTPWERRRPAIPNLEELDLRDNKVKEGIRDLVPAFPFRLRPDLFCTKVSDTPLHL